MAKETKLHLGQDWNDRDSTDEIRPLHSAELEMREALNRLGKKEQTGFGLQALPRPSHTQNRHRFVREGEVAVTVLRRGTERSASAPGVTGQQRPVADIALAEERAERARLQQWLEGAHATIRNLQTQLGHMEAARDEAVAALEKEQVRVAPAHERVSELQQRMARSEHALQAVQEHLDRERRDCKAAKARAQDLERLVDTLSQGMSGPLEHDLGSLEAEPVKWWLNPKPKRR